MSVKPLAGPSITYISVPITSTIISTDRQEHADLAAAGGQRLDQRLVFGDVGGQLEDPEDPQQPQDPHVDQHIQARNEQRQVRRQQGHQVDDAEEAAHVAHLVRHRGQPRQVFDA